MPACAIAPEALAAPYATHVGQPARAAGFLLMGIPAGTVAADVIAARLLSSRMQRRIIVPAGLLAFAPLAVFAASPGLGPALGLLLISGAGSAWHPGIDRLLIDTAPPDLRNRALALGAAGLMFTQGLGFTLWGIAGQYAPLAAVIPLAAIAGMLAVLTLRPHQPRSTRDAAEPGQPSTRGAAPPEPAPGPHCTASHMPTLPSPRRLLPRLPLSAFARTGPRPCSPAEAGHPAWGARARTGICGWPG